MDGLTDENCDIKMEKEKLEDELNEKKRAAEGIEFVSNTIRRSSFSDFVLSILLNDV